MGFGCLKFVLQFSCPFFQHFFLINIISKLKIESLKIFQLILLIFQQIKYTSRNLIPKQINHTTTKTNKKGKKKNLNFLCYKPTLIHTSTQTDIQQKTRQKMFLLLPCATIKDNLIFPSVGDAQKIAGEMTKIRNNIKEYSNVETLLKRIQDGQVIMLKKVQFDNYMKAQVDLMRGCVLASVPCPFVYASYLDGEKTVSAAGVSTKEQWAVEMVMSRYTISSIYHAAAYSSLEFIFRQTQNSFNKNYKQSANFIKNIQIAFKYFNQGYQPLKRLQSGYQNLVQLLSKSFMEQNQILELHPQIFKSITNLVACNLGYLKLQKYRLMCQYRSCKELAYAIYNVLVDTKKGLVSHGLLNSVHPDMKVFLDVGQIFFKGYAYYFLLEEHEDIKNKEDYGFVKKQFQQMIIQNCLVCQSFLALHEQLNKFPNKQNLDNLIFAGNVFETMKKQVLRKQYTYGINIHENKQLQSQLPTIQQVIERRIASKKVQEFIAIF